MLQLATTNINNKQGEAGKLTALFMQKSKMIPQKLYINDCVFFLFSFFPSFREPWLKQTFLGLTLVLLFDQAEKDLSPDSP